MSMPGPYELIIILLIVLLLFGGRKIPEIARGIGKGIREFRKARDEVLSAVEDDNDDSGSRRGGDSVAKTDTTHQSQTKEGSQAQEKQSATEDEQSKAKDQNE